MADDEVPVVSGVSPKEGYPGTKVTIRGQNLGINKNDVTSESCNFSGKVGLVSSKSYLFFAALFITFRPDNLWRKLY